MRIFTILAVLAVAASPAFAGVLIGNNPNVSDGGLNMTPPGAWQQMIITGSNSTSKENDRHGPDGGDWSVNGSDGGGHSPAWDAYWYQRFTVASGAIQAGATSISLSGWSKAYAQWWSGENWNWVQEAHVELWVDGAKVFDGVSSNNTNRDTWAEHQYNGTVNVTDHVEVRLHTVKGNDQYGTGNLGAIWWSSRYDDIRLFACPAGSTECCPNPMSVTAVNPSSYTIPPALGTAEIVTITGENLTSVQGVQLAGPVIVSGTIVNQTATEIQAAFDLSAAPRGSYTLNVDRDNSGNCMDVVVADAVTINCGTPDAAVATFQNDRGLHGNAAHISRLTGSNLAGISSVRLHKSNKSDGVSDIVGTNLHMVGSDLEVTFDLTNAEAGRWDVVYEMGTACATVTPTSHKKAMLVYMPELTNASFEEPYAGTDPKTVLCPLNGPDNPKAKHWDDMTVGPRNGGDHRRDAHVFGPECVDGRIKNLTGQHYGGSDLVTSNEGTPTTWTVFQTIAAPNLDSERVTTEAFNIRAELAGNGGTEYEPVTIKIRLLDGTETDYEQVLAETEITADISDNGLHANPDYNAAIPAGVQYLSDPPILTIAFEFTAAGGGVTGLGYFGFFLDNVRSGIFVPPACVDHAVWADNNRDNAVDMRDFATLQACLTSGASTVESLSAECVCFDRDFDSQLTDTDMIEFIKCATGPGVTWSADAVPLCTP